MTDTDTLALEIAREVENIISDTPADRAIQRQARVQVVVKNALDAALADRDAKIAKLERLHAMASHGEWLQQQENLRLCKVSEEQFARAKVAEAQVAELTQKLERATEALGRIASNGFGHPARTIDPTGRDKELWAIMQYASDTYRALNSGASQNG